MADLAVTIETDKHGNHFVVFPGRYDELVPPEHYDERLVMIGDSCTRYLSAIKNLDDLREAFRIN